MTEAQLEGLFGGLVAKRRPVMQQSVIINELHVTWLKLHAEMEDGVICELIEQIERPGRALVSISGASGKRWALSIYWR